jgi:hypothetical protein
MNINFESINTKISIVNQSLQIVAILVAAVWAIWTWQKMNGDSMDTGLVIDFSYENKWIPDLEACGYQVNFEVKNEGYKTKEIKSEILEIYLAPLIKLENVHAHVGNYLDEVKQKSIKKVTYDSNHPSLNPKEKYKKGLTFVTKPSGINGFIFTYNYFDEEGRQLAGLTQSLEPCKAPES